MKTPQKRLEKLMEDEYYRSAFSKYDYHGDDYLERAMGLAHDVKCLRHQLEILSDSSMKTDIALQSLVSKIQGMEFDDARRLAFHMYSDFGVPKGIYKGDKSDEIKERFEWKNPVDDKLRGISFDNIIIDDPLATECPTFEIGSFFSVWNRSQGWGVEPLITNPYRMDGEIPLVFIHLGRVQFFFENKWLYKKVYKYIYGEEIE